jgi:hypothetical protein
VRIPSSWPLRIAYASTLLGFLLPFTRGLLGSTPGIRLGAWSYVLLVPALILAATCLWRLVIVLSDRNALDSFAVDGALLAARRVGTLLIYLGAAVLVLSVLGGPIVWLLLSHHTESGAEYFLLRLFLALFTGIGPVGLVAFEFSRMRSFELKDPERDT